MREVRFGVVGTGKITDWWIAGAKLDPRFKLVAVCSRNRETADSFARKYGLGLAFTSLREMVSCHEIDAIYIATPNFLHAKQSILCMRHGKHVICEKPLASNAFEVKAMIEVAEKNKVSLMEAMLSTLNPNFRAVKEALPKLGTVHRFFSSYCQYSSRYEKLKEGELPNVFNHHLSSCALNDLGIYPLYAMIALFGKPLRICCDAVFYNNSNVQGDILCHYNGMIANIIYGKNTNSYLPTEIQGENGNLILDEVHVTRKVTFVERPEANSGRGPQPLFEVFENRLKNDEYYYETSEFIDMIEQHRISSSINSHELSLATMEVMDQIRKQMGIFFDADNANELSLDF